MESILRLDRAREDNENEPRRPPGGSLLPVEWLAPLLRARSPRKGDEQKRENGCCSRIYGGILLSVSGSRRMKILRRCESWTNQGFLV